MRRLWALTVGLPPEAAVWRDGSRWSPENELAAVAIERADIWGHLLAQVMGANAKALPAPITFTHPDRVTAAPAKNKPVTDPAQIKQFLAGIGR